jgi:hypothetical protein
MSISREEKHELKTLIEKSPQRDIPFIQDTIRKANFHNFLQFYEGKYTIDLNGILVEELARIKVFFQLHLLRDPISNTDIENLSKDAEKLSQEQLVDVMDELKQEGYLPINQSFDKSFNGEIEVTDFAPITIRKLRDLIHKKIYSTSEVKRPKIQLNFTTTTLSREDYVFRATKYSDLFAQGAVLPNKEVDLELRNPSAGRLYVTRKKFKENEIPFCFSFDVYDGMNRGKYVLEGSFGSAGLPNDAIRVPLNAEDEELRGSGSLGVFQTITLQKVSLKSDKNTEFENITAKSCYELKGFGSVEGTNKSKPNPIIIRIHFVSKFFESSAASSNEPRTLIVEMQRVKNTAQCRLVKFLPIAGHKYAEEIVYGEGTECIEISLRKKRKFKVTKVKPELTVEEKKEQVRRKQLRKENIENLMERYFSRDADFTFSKEEEKIIEKQIEKYERKKEREEMKKKNETKKKKKESESDSDEGSGSESDF